MAIKINGVLKDSTVLEPSNFPIGVYHLAANPQLYEVQRSNNYFFVLTDLDNLRSPQNGDRFPNAQEYLRISTQSAFVPSYGQQPIDVYKGNGTMHYAGRPSFSSGQIKLVDYIGLDTKRILEAWQALSYNPYTEKVGLITDYKKNGAIIEYTPDYQKVRQWNLYGCWITNLTEDGFDDNANSAHMISCDLIYDFFRLESDVTE